jgi:hypothetical protein
VVFKAWSHVAWPTDICWKCPNHDVLINTFPQQKSVKKMLRRRLVFLVVHVRAWCNNSNVQESLDDNMFVFSLD